jgi:CBS domain containing-hemolysin-like protein
MNDYLLILFAIVFSAFFSGMEIAFVSSNKLRIELDRKQGAFGSGIIRFFTIHPGQYIATMLIGNNISLVIYGLIIARLLSPLIYPLVGSDAFTLILQTIISTGIILLVAEFLPKTIFLLNPNFFLKSLSIPSLFFFLLFYPVSKTTLIISNFIIRVFFGIKTLDKRQEDVVFSKVDLDHFVNMNTQSTEEDEPEQHNLKIFQNALDLSNVRIRECMIPRTEIEAIEINSSIDILREVFVETRLSRILVYQESIDHVTGYFELKDIFKNPPDIQSGIRKLVIVPETMPASKLLKQFVDEKKNIAVVVDEFGGTSGMVTIEDILEEIVGDIEDEHDINEMVEKETGPGEFVFSGRLEIDYLNEKYQLNLPEKDDYETLAGMVLFFNGSIPKTNDIIRVGNKIIRVLRVTATRLDLLKITQE